jgi:hypothetical protein
MGPPTIMPSLIVPPNQTMSPSDRHGRYFPPNGYAAPNNVSGQSTFVSTHGPPLDSQPPVPFMPSPPTQPASLHRNPPDLAPPQHVMNVQIPQNSSFPISEFDIPIPKVNGHFDHSMVS